MFVPSQSVEACSGRLCFFQEQPSLPNVLSPFLLLHTPLLSFLLFAMPRTTPRQEYMPSGEHEKEHRVPVPRFNAAWYRCQLPPRAMGQVQPACRAWCRTLPG